MSDEDLIVDDNIAGEANSVEADGADPSSIRKQEERQELNQQIEAFLASGGKINYVEPNVMADPPKKPTSNYGSQPI